MALTLYRLICLFCESSLCTQDNLGEAMIALISWWYKFVEQVWGELNYFEKNEMA